jgi:hypothetical protein
MKYFGIKTPKTIKDDSYISWISYDEHNCWSMFLNHSGKDDQNHRFHGSMSEAIRAYESIGYKLVELDVLEKEIEDNIVRRCNGCLALLKDHYVYCPMCGKIDDKHQLYKLYR